MANMKRKKRYILGRNTKNVSILPNGFLKLIGRIDAHKGKEVALAHLNRYFEKCTSIEDVECLISEEFLKKARTEGAANLDIIENTPQEQSDASGAAEAGHAWEVLESRKCKGAVKAARSRLYEINEEIVNGTSILDQRIAKIRKKAASKIAAYIKGVRAGGIASFDPVVTFSDVAVDKYYKKHKRDRAIAAAAAAETIEEG